MEFANLKKTALVTGGTRGIGRAIVETLVAQGYRVFATYVKSKQLAEELEAKYGEISYSFFNLNKWTLTLLPRKHCWRNCLSPSIF